MLQFMSGALALMEKIRQQPPTRSLIEEIPPNRVMIIAQRTQSDASLIQRAAENSVNAMSLTKEQARKAKLQLAEGIRRRDEYKKEADRRRIEIADIAQARFDASEKVKNAQRELENRMRKQTVSKAINLARSLVATAGIGIPIIEGQLVPGRAYRIPGKAAIYIYMPTPIRGLKHIPDWETYEAMGSPKVFNLTQEMYNRTRRLPAFPSVKQLPPRITVPTPIGRVVVTTRPLVSGRFYKLPNKPEVYYYIGSPGNSMLRHVPDMETFKSLGSPRIYDIDQNIFNKTKKGPALPSVKKQIVHMPVEGVPIDRGGRRIPILMPGPAPTSPGGLLPGHWKWYGPDTPGAGPRRGWIWVSDRRVFIYPPQPPQAPGLRIVIPLEKTIPKKPQIDEDKRILGRLEAQIVQLETAFKQAEGANFYSNQYGLIVAQARKLQDQLNRINAPNILPSGIGSGRTNLMARLKELINASVNIAKTKLPEDVVGPPAWKGFQGERTNRMTNIVEKANRSGRSWDEIIIPDYSGNGREIGLVGPEPKTFADTATGVATTKKSMLPWLILGGLGLTTVGVLISKKKKKRKK